MRRPDPRRGVPGRAGSPDARGHWTVDRRVHQPAPIRHRVHLRRRHHVGRRAHHLTRADLRRLERRARRRRSHNGAGGLHEVRAGIAGVDRPGARVRARGDGRRLGRRGSGRVSRGRGAAHRRAARGRVGTRSELQAKLSRPLGGSVAVDCLTRPWAAGWSAGS